MVSVIIPVYNVEKYLRRCLDSVVGQTYKDLEIILVDDGSTDGSTEICEEYAKKDSRIRFLRKQNGGLSSARNAGLLVATGEYVTFVDSDDYIEDFTYERLILNIEKTGAEICVCGSNTILEDGVVVAKDFFEEKIYDTEQIINNFILNLKTSVWNKLYNRKIIKNVVFPNGRIHGEDLVFNLNIMYSGIKMSSIPDCCYNYIKRENSITTQAFSEKAFDEVWCKDKAYEIIKNKFPEFSRKALVWRFRARMNLIRKMTKVGPDGFSEIYNDYICWVKGNYRKIKASLNAKEKTEFFLLKLSSPLYKKIVKFF